MTKATFSAGSTWASSLSSVSPFSKLSLQWKLWSAFCTFWVSWKSNGAQILRCPPKVLLCHSGATLHHLLYKACQLGKEKPEWALNRCGFFVCEPIQHSRETWHSVVNSSGLHQGQRQDCHHASRKRKHNRSQKDKTLAWWIRSVRKKCAALLGLVSEEKAEDMVRNDFIWRKRHGLKREEVRGEVREALLSGWSRSGRNCEHGMSWTALGMLVNLDPSVECCPRLLHIPNFPTA